MEVTLPGSEAEPRIALVTDSDLNRHLLQGVVRDAGCRLTISLSVDQLSEQLKRLAITVDAWLVDLQEQCSDELLELLSAHRDIPLLVNDDVPSMQDNLVYGAWRRRLIEKLELVAVRSGGVPTRSLGSERSAKHIWVLAASMGGPEAVNRFLAALPAGLPVSMVYAQHIDTDFDEKLVATIARKQHYPVRLLRGEQQLLPGQLLVVPVDRQLSFLPFGRIVETRKPWGGSYQPAIDQVVAELARLYRKNFGVIIFSGLCNDGEIGCRVARASGSKVWAQTPVSCANSAMPDAAISTGCVSYQGTPEELAQRLAIELGNKEQEVL